TGAAGGAQAEGDRKVPDRAGLGRPVHGRQEQPPDLRVPDRVRDLAGLAGDVAAPDRVPLWPEILALVVETAATGVDDDAERDRVEPGGDAAVEPGRPRVDGDRVKAPFLASPGRAVRVKGGEHQSIVVPGTTDEVVVGGVPPVPPEPGDVGLEPAAGADHGPGPQRAVRGAHRRAHVALPTRV